MNAVTLTAQVLRSFLDPPPDGTTSAADAWSTVAELPPVGPPVPLPPPAPAPGTGLPDVLRRRRSVRFFGDAALDLPALLGAVAAGLDADRARFPGEADCCPVTPILVAQRVAGLPPAMYRLDPSGRTAVAVAHLSGPEAARELTLQQEFAEAGAIVSLLGNLDRAHLRHGGPGYRTLMVRAGAIGYQIWLDAVDRGLVGTVFAGFLPAAVRAPLRCDGVSRHQLFAVAVGHPAPLGQPTLAAAQAQAPDRDTAGVTPAGSTADHPGTPPGSGGRDAHEGR